MSLSGILHTASSGLHVAQSGLRLVSDNVANVNTPGYVRKILDQSAVVVGGAGQGVDVARVRLAADRFLQAAGLGAAASAARADATAGLLDSAQSLFGDPAGDASFFARLDSLFGALEASAAEPASATLRGEAVRAVGAFFDDAARIGDGVAGLGAQADARLASGVHRVNQLLGEIETLNAAISRTRVAGGAPAGAEAAQAGLIDELATLMDVNVSPRAAGGVTLRTAGGLTLAGDGVGRLALGSDGVLTVTSAAGGEARPLADQLTGGELKGLLDGRDRELPVIAEQLGVFVAAAAEELNRAHNAASAVPPPSRLVGRDTGLDLPTAVAGFTGRSVIAVTGADGKVSRRVEIDFSAGTLRVNGGAATTFSPAGFGPALDAALAPAARAGYTGRALTLEATGGGGVIVADDPAAPSAKAGRSFAHAFGLNDLVRGPASYATGLRPADPHGFGAGQTLTLRLSGEGGGRLRDVTVAVPAGSGMVDVLGALNASGSGVGLYGRFDLDGEGRLGFTATTTPPASLSVVADGTARGAGGPSLSSLFGLGTEVRATRASAFGVRADIAADPRKLALARYDPATAVGAQALAAGDGRGGQALEALVSALSRRGADFSGALGARAAAAVERQSAAGAIAAEAGARRASVEGVNLDEELVLMTTYQQAYSANARMIQAAKDLYDVLLSL